MKAAAEMCYALIMPVRDEENYIGPMIESILTQTVLPAKWIIVDDGSSDRTAEIVARYCKEYSFLQLIRLPARDKRSAGGEGAIPAALSALNLNQYDFLGRFDADLLFEPDYIANILKEFVIAPRLGIAGGGLYIQTADQMELEKEPRYHVRGALKMYRRECLQQIGGITTTIGWDTIDEVSAWTKGWTTRSFVHYKVIHRRPTGKGIRSSRLYWERGRAEYLTWSAPSFVVAKAIKVAVQQVSLLRPVSYLAGFCGCYILREARLQDIAFVKARREQQRNRLSAVFQRRRLSV